MISAIIGFKDWFRGDTFRFLVWITAVLSGKAILLFLQWAAYTLHTVLI